MKKILFVSVFALCAPFMAFAATFGAADIGTSTYTGADFENTDFLDLDPEDPSYFIVTDPTGDYLYVFVTWGNRVLKIETDTLTVVGTLDIPGGGTFQDGRLAAIDSSNQYLYVALQASPSQIARVHLDDFSTVDMLTLNSSEDWALALELDTANAFAYVSVFSSPNSIVKVDLNTFTRVASSSLSATESNPRDIVIDSTDTYAYVILRDGSDAVAKIDLNTFTRVDGITFAELGPSSPLLDVGFIHPTDGFLYVTGGSRITRIDLSTFSVDGSESMSANSESWDMVLASSTNQVYAGFYTSPGKVMQVDLDSSVQVATTTLQTGANYPISLALDPSGLFLYVGGETYPGHIVKVALPTLPATYPQNLVLSSEATLPETAQSIDSVSFYSHEAAGNVRVAIFDSNEDLLWESGSIANTAAEDWVTVNIADGTPTTLTSIPAGTYYLALLTDTTSDIFSATTTSPGDGRMLSHAYGAFPASLSAAEETDQTWSVYATYTVVPAPVPENDGSSSSGSRRRCGEQYGLPTCTPTTTPSTATTTEPAQQDPANVTLEQLQTQLIELLKQLLQILLAQQQS